MPARTSITISSEENCTWDMERDACQQKSRAIRLLVIARRASSCARGAALYCVRRWQRERSRGQLG